MYYNIAERALNDILGRNYKLIIDYSADVQTSLNKSAGLRIKGIKPPKNQDRINGLKEKVQEKTYEETKWVLQEPTINFSQSTIDDTIKTNVDFHIKLGLRPKIVRKMNGNCCDWCKEVEGEYKYPNVPKDVFRRHRFCRCTVEYEPGNGKRQNVHTKKWRDIDQEEKIENRINSNIYDKININNKQFGKKASKHMREFNLDPSDSKDRRAFKRKIKSISNNPDDVIRGIDWRGYKDPVVAYVSGDDVVLVTNNNEFITIMKGGVNNARIKNKRKR